MSDPTPKINEEAVERFSIGYEVVENSTVVPRNLEIARMFLSEDGPYVSYEDYAALRERVENDVSAHVEAALSSLASEGGES